MRGKIRGLRILPEPPFNFLPVHHSGIQFNGGSFSASTSATGRTATGIDWSNLAQTAGWRLNSHPGISIVDLVRAKRL
jgi:hypothetical protein